MRAPVLLLLFLILIARPFSPFPALAGPVNSDAVLLAQPDGMPFWARHYGDEWDNGVETLDGYTVLRDAGTRIWKYAEKTLRGELIPSAAIVGRDAPRFIQPKLRAELAPGAANPRTAAEIRPLDAPQLGARAALIILVQFQNQTAQTTANTWAAKIFGPSGSVKAHYAASSYNQFDLVPAAESHGSASDGIVGWLTLNYNHPNTAGSTGSANQQITRDALIAADPYVNFAAYDTNNNGVISADELMIVVIVAGNETSFGGSTNSCAPSVWGHKWTLFGGVSPVTLDGKSIGGSGYGQFGEMHCRNSNPPGSPATIGIIAHEMGHLLGLPDLYDTDGSSIGVGKWSLMASGSWNAVAQSGDSPSLMDPWSKYFLGWVAPAQVTGTLTNQSIAAAATTPDLFKFLNGTPAGGEYFLVENRQRIGFDAGLPGAGLLVWHIEESQATNRNECIPGGTPACSSSVHYKVAVVQADNAFNLERNQNSGDGGDPFPGSGNKLALTDNTTPTSRLYSGAASGISITDIGPSGPSMTATLSIGGSTTTPVISVTPASQDFGTVAVGSTAERTFTVQNVGGGTLSGSANTTVPFSVVSGGGYSLGAGASQTVTVRFSPAAAANFSGNISFSGGATPVSGLLTGVGGTVQCVVVIAPNTTVNGTLSDTDCTSTVRPPAKGDRYSFSGTPGQVVTITLQAPLPSFDDTYLTLLGPSGSAVATNDDCSFPSDLSSCINNFVLSAAGTYSIEASAYNANARGAYSLTFTSSATPVLTVTPASLDFGVVTVGASADRVFTVQNSGTGTLTGSPSTSAPFSIVGGGGYSLAAGASQNVTIRFGPGAAGNFANNVTFSNSAGAGVVRAVSGSTASIPCTTTAIAPGNSIAGTLEATDCDAPHLPGSRADLYSFTAIAGQTATINMTSTVFDTYLLLIGPANTVIASNHDCPGLHTFDSCLTNTVLPANGAYTIEASSFVGTGLGEYTIHMQISGQGYAKRVDFDGDGRSDVGIYRAGVWSLIRSTNSGNTVVGWGGAMQDIPVPGDYDGDGRSDVAIYRDGVWSVYRSSDSGNTVAGLGVAGSIPVPADYDGDGKADFAVYDSAGVWTILRSSTNTRVMTGWGGDPQDVAVPADYDGDGKVDIAIFREGAWSIIKSTDGSNLILGLGTGAHKPVPGDYDGDGKADIAVYKEGVWLIRQSSNGQTVAVGWGGAHEPVPADYDGDGKTDIAVYMNGVWSILRSSDGGNTLVGWGGDPLDIPLSAER